MSRVRVISAAWLTVLMLGWSAAAASATTYCVTTPAAPPGCSGTNESTLADALTAASGDASGSDQIVLPQGVTTGPAGGYKYTGGASLTLQGQGPSSIITLSSGGTQPVFSDTGTEPAIAVRSLAVLLPSGETAGGIAVGAPANVTGVYVKGGAAASGYGIALGGGGVVQTASVAISGGPDVDPGVFISGNATATVNDSVLVDRTGLETTGPGKTVIHRSVLLGANQTAALIANEAPVSIDDSVLYATDGASGIEAFGGGASVVGTQLTIAGDSTATGVHVQTPDGASAPAQVNLSDSIIANPLQHSFALFTANGAPHASAKTDYCDYDRSTILSSGTFTPGAHDTQPTQGNAGGYVNPQFVDLPLFDFQLSPDSPLLNLDPTPLGGTPVGSIESATDLDGRPRITLAGRDLGAFQHVGPAITSAKATPTHAKVKHAITFTAAATTAASNATLKYAWTFDDHKSANGQTVKHAFKRPGTHTATVTVTDSTGYAVHRSVTVTVTSPPVITHAARRGKYIVFTLNGPAKVRLKFTLRRGPRAVHVTVKLQGTTGVNRFKFVGKNPAHGTYTVIVTARSRQGTAKPRTIHFRF